MQVVVLDTGAASAGWMQVRAMDGQEGAVPDTVLSKLNTEGTDTAVFPFAAAKAAVVSSHVGNGEPHEIEKPAAASAMKDQQVQQVGGAFEAFDGQKVVTTAIKAEYLIVGTTEKDEGAGEYFVVGTDACGTGAGRAPPLSRAPATDSPGAKWKKEKNAAAKAAKAERKAQRAKIDAAFEAQRLKRAGGAGNNGARTPTSNPTPKRGAGFTPVKKSAAATTLTESQPPTAAVLTSRASARTASTPVAATAAAAAATATATATEPPPNVPVCTTATATATATATTSTSTSTSTIPAPSPFSSSVGRNNKSKSETTSTAQSAVGAVALGVSQRVGRGEKEAKAAAKAAKAERKAQRAKIDAAIEAQRLKRAGKGNGRATILSPKPAAAAAAARHKPSTPAAISKLSKPPKTSPEDAVTIAAPTMETKPARASASVSLSLLQTSSMPSTAAARSDAGVAGTPPSQTATNTTTPKSSSNSNSGKGRAVPKWRLEMEEKKRQESEKRKAVEKKKKELRLAREEANGTLKPQRPKPLLRRGVSDSSTHSDSNLGDASPSAPPTKLGRFSPSVKPSPGAGAAIAPVSPLQIIGSLLGSAFSPPRAAKGVSPSHAGQRSPPPVAVGNAAIEGEPQPAAAAAALDLQSELEQPEPEQGRASAPAVMTSPQMAGSRVSTHNEDSDEEPDLPPLPFDHLQQPLPGVVRSVVSSRSGSPTNMHALQPQLKVRVGAVLLHLNSGLINIVCAFFIRPTLIPPPFLALFWMVVLLRVQISRFVLRYLLLRARAHNPSATPLLSSLAHAPFLCSLILILLFKQSSPYFRRLSQYTRSHSRASESPPVRALVCSGLPWDTCRNAAPPPRLFFFFPLSASQVCGS